MVFEEVRFDYEQWIIRRPDRQWETGKAIARHGEQARK